MNLNRITRVELGTALAALALALIAGGYLAITTFAGGQTCYGISGAKIVCHTIATPAEAAQAGGRVVVVFSTVLLIYIAGVLAAWWQTRTTESSARWTAYMTLVTCALTVVAITLAALGGVGFFFIPGTALMVVATVVGFFAARGASRGAAA